MFQVKPGHIRPLILVLSQLGVVTAHNMHCMDFQKILPLPSITTSEVYYKIQLSFIPLISTTLVSEICISTHFMKLLQVKALMKLLQCHTTSVQQKFYHLCASCRFSVTCVQGKIKTLWKNPYNFSSTWTFLISYLEVDKSETHTETVDDWREEIGRSCKKSFTIHSYKLWTKPVSPVHILA